jgi:LmbE family N-acetylglucosaminyl deacetylase
MTTREPLPASTIPVRRPQFHLRDGAIYFLVSRRPQAELDAEERAVWEAMDGETTVERLRARFPDSAERAVHRFLDLGLCALVAASFPAERRKVVVFEPHVDDAVLSIGGTMWRRRLECEFLLVTIAGRSNFTSYYYLDREYFDVDTVSALRRAEAELFVRSLGGRHLALAEKEAPLRYQDGNWTLDWFRRHRASVSAFIAHRSGPEELAAWTAAVGGVLERVPADEVWMPLGVGPHTDHELCRNACLAYVVSAADRMAGRALRFYQEVPYASQFPGYTDRLLQALARSGAKLEREESAITDAMEDKLRLVSHFGSQFKLEALAPGIEASARAAAGESGGLAELLYRLDAPPRELDTLSLYVDEDIVRQTATGLAPWLARNRRARRVRLVLRVPAGRWAEDLELLLRALPEARIEAHVATAALAEAEAHPSPRVSVREIAGGGAGLARRALELALSPPAPTLLLLGIDRARHARALSSIWPLSDTLIAPTMNHLAIALRLAEDALRPPASHV